MEQEEKKKQNTYLQVLKTNRKPYMDRILEK